jgi:AcrR family transcriptional regulator
MEGVIAMRDCVKRRRGRRSATEPEVPDEAEILRHGLEAFAELGYAGASVRELARRLGVSHNFINDRYGSKAAFWEAAVSGELARTKARIDEVIAGECDDACRFAAVVRNFYRIAAHSPLLNRVMADESSRESERIDYLHQHYIGPTLAALEPTIARLAAAGRMPPLPTHLIFLAVTGPAISLTQDPLARRLGLPDQTHDDITAAADALASAVLNGILQPAPAAIAEPS